MVMSFLHHTGVAMKTSQWAGEAVTIANYIGDASFALTGSLAAGREGMDLLGCTVVGFVTALGGGTFRDVMLGRFPIWWMVQWDEAVLCVTVSVVAFIAWPTCSKSFRLTLEDEWLFWTDTLGVGAFAALGAHTATQTIPEPHFGACAACGMFAATFGGLTRDVLVARPPRILYAQSEMYALPAFLGGAAYTLVHRWLPGEAIVESIVTGALTAVILRVIAVTYDVRMPTFPEDVVYSIDSRPRDAAAAMVHEQEASWQRDLRRRRSKVTWEYPDSPLAQSLSLAS